ncbi:MAG: sodium-dependent transporter [Clostridia bacterium]|nr:sodium-dependent transporter [Clostridia bacterium]
MENNTQQKRSSFTGKIGFVLAAAGSAVGLGNIWRFPYLAAKYGGGIFLLVYVLLAVTFGFVLMLAEIAIGRKTGKSAIGAFAALDKRFSFVGWLAAAVPIIILPYYSVIGGWVMKYIFGYATGEGSEMAKDTYFTGYLGEVGEPLIWFGIFVLLTAVVVFFGVEKGIEKVSKVMMPVLIIFMLFIIVYSLCTMDGIWEGVLYYITPDFSNFSIMTVVTAMGQLFYSMSLAMGIMITFGSYMKKDISIEKSIHQIEIFDSGVAFLSGLLIVPAVFATSGGSAEALGKGPSLMFVTLPKIFETMPGGSIVGAVFFAMVFLAAITSSISLMETIISIVMDKTKLSRRVSCLIVFGIILLFGIPSSLGFNVWSEVLFFGKLSFLDFFDFISNSIMMPIVAIITCIFVGFFIKPKAILDEAALKPKSFWGRMFDIVIRFVAPIFLVAILVTSVLEVFGVIVI